MAERKVLSKYFPPDFNPSLIVRTRGPKQVGPKVQTVRLMAPFPMKCTACGEYIYKGRKFNARKETTEERYYSIPIYRFYIRCTRCSGEITFKTDPRNMDYVSERGAKRNTEPWRMNGGGKQESDEERLDRLEREEEEKNAMQELETKTLDAKREMAVADALDEIRTRNARNERVGKDGLEVTVVRESIDEERQRQEQEDDEAARLAFMKRYEAMEEIVVDDEDDDQEAALEMPPPSFKRVKKKKKDHAAALGIKKKPSLV
ncbi:putative cell cycle control protein cwf16 [Venustampulla echinocandica]|uniref:Splicing factor YJU2 n=1 Tax=Venustampulla echinocandica TaxID=2656787 RepID=A0A370TLH7_9HELO|nr:putative cell cycle control protein cwf16 [Venustampulla echinocandica]RDL36369.1 putative cell cycle control protein cwf16 [Venustampulla echinocandica]